MNQTQIKHKRVTHPTVGINQFSCAYGTRSHPCGTLSVAINLETYAQIKTNGARTFTPVCPECHRRTIVHIG